MAGSTKTTLRQDVWQAAYSALTAQGYADAREMADRVTERFTANRAATTGGVPAETKLAIEADLTAGGYSFAALRDKHGVGMSTVQRIAAEMRGKGTTVRTAGQTNPGSTLN